jgi:hypothetical protein
MSSRVVAAALLLFLTSGCTRPWNTAHTALEAVAQATAATDTIIAQAMVTSHEEAREAILEEARADQVEFQACIDSGRLDEDCNRPPIEYYMEQYQEQVRAWEAVTVALEEVREVLILAEVAVETWRDAKTEPEGWRTICGRLDTVTSSIVRAIEAAGVDVPDQWTSIQGYLEPVCVSFVGGEQ